MRGVQRRAPNGLVLIVSGPFYAFLQRQSDRTYRTLFLPFLSDALAADPADDLLWPVSREETLFEKTAETTRAYGLPSSRDSIVLDPAASEFIGFKKASHGMEFWDGADCVRFTPDAVEFTEEGESRTFTFPNVLLGWALDDQGRVCACYRKHSGFIPPPEFKLLRFLAEDQRDQERSVLNVLAEIG